MNRGLRQIVLLGMVFAGLSGGALAQPYQSLTLADVDGFTDDARYPLGPLQAGAHGPAWWMPAAQPAHIVATDDLHGKALRRAQTGTDQMDILHFPAVSNGVLRIQFEARASTAASRTLDIFLLPTIGGETCLLGWGTVRDQLCYYDGAAWIPVRGLDTNWHRIEMIVHLSGPQFPGWDLQVDDTLLATNLPWRNSHPADTPYSRLRIGGIRGASGTFADVDNLVITAEVLPGVAEELKLVAPRLADGRFSFAFATKPQREYVVQSATNAAVPAWTPLDLVGGDGTEMRWTNPAPAAAMQFHRVAQQPPPGRADGYRGIWFTLGQFSQYGDKYSGGLGTYTANHLPLAVYAPAVNKTFFTYGGTVAGQRHLLIMASVYDHATGQVPRPTVVHDKNGVNDPHDNGSLTLDAAGYVWIFISGRARARPGFIYRSRAPYSVAEFDLVQSDEITYPQPWRVAERGFLLLFTKYTAGRELYWQTSVNGTNWSGHHKLAGLSGHYQVSGEHQGKICTYFNRHPGGSVDKRTDLYFLQTTDFGGTWTTADGTPVSVPVTTTNHPARVFDYASQGRLMYTCDLNFDAHGRPLLLYLTSRDHRPGPAGAPREWTLARWTGAQWLTHVICQSDHNYDMGSLYVLTDRWVVIGPTQPGPQAWQTGGEMALWTSDDLGATWALTRQITTNSLYNHTYARRPLNAADPFSVFWADGDPTQVTPSRLYFSNLEGTEVRQLPYAMPTLWATPERLP